MLDYLPGVSRTPEKPIFDFPPKIGLKKNHDKRVVFAKRFEIQVVSAVDIIVNFEPTEFLVKAVVLAI